MSAGPKIPGLSDAWAQHQLDLLELAEQSAVRQEPACRWAHGEVQELNARGLCPVCAADDDEGAA